MGRPEQEKRMRKFVAMMKERKFPNSTKMKAAVASVEGSSSVSWNISESSLRRDRIYLENKFNAPIAYCSINKGFYLKDPSWSFPGFDLDEGEAHVLTTGAKLAEDMMPQPLRSRLAQLSEDQLSRSEGHFESPVDTFFSADTVVVDIDREVMETVYECWRQARVLNFTYHHPDGRVSMRRVAPAVVTFSNRLWYVKGFCYQKQAPRIFALHRMREASMDVKRFELDQKEWVKRQHRQDFFEYPKVSGVQLRCKPELAVYVREQADFRGIILEELADGWLLLTLPELNENELIRWILGCGDQLEVLAPQEFREQLMAEVGRMSAIYNKTGE